MHGHGGVGTSSRPAGRQEREEGEVSAPRAALRTAQEVAAGAARAAQAARWLVERAAQQVSEAEAALAVFEGLDAAVAAWRAGLLKAGGAAVRELMPPDLAESRRARADAAEDLADATATATLLAVDAKEADAVAEQAAGAVRSAMDAVMQAVASELLGSMRQAEAEAGRLRVVVMAMSGARPVSDPPLPWTLSQVTHEPLHPLMLDVAQLHRPAATDAWNAFRTALEADPDTRFTA